MVNLFESAIALHSKGRLEEAKEKYRELLTMSPRHADSLHALGIIAIQEKNFEVAVDLIRKSLEIDSLNAAAYCNLGDALRARGSSEEALASYERARNLAADFLEPHLKRAAVLRGLGRFEEALKSYHHVLAINPADVATLVNRGITLKSLRRFDEAIASYDQAIKLKPNFAEAFYNRGNALGELERFNEAVASYDLAIAIKADYSQAIYARATALEALNDYEQAALGYERALALNRDHEFVVGALAYSKQQICDWRRYDEFKETIAARLLNRQRVSLPWPVLSLLDSPRLQRLTADIWVERERLQGDTASPQYQSSPKGKIRLGYYSSDFHDHATSQLMVGLFEAHNRDAFELYAFSYGPITDDHLQRRVIEAFDRFIDVRAKDDAVVAALSRDLGIDIAIDLKGFTKYARPGIFAHRCAPVQVSYLGYPGSVGARYMDYLIADETLIPAKQQMHYSEKIVYLPNSYQVNDNKRVIADKVFSRGECNLPEGVFVYCCFNSAYKITPSTFASWMAILKSTGDSVLWLLGANQKAAENLREEAEQRGVDPKRLIFAPFMPLAEHLSRLRLADLFLDTLPCNAHTTASDALWAGVPVLTQVGESFAARVAASLLKAIELPELITETPEQYVHQAVDYARDREKLGKLRKKLAEKRLTAPLFDTALFCRHLEAAFKMISQRQQAGMPPDHFQVEP